MKEKKTKQKERNTNNIYIYIALIYIYIHIHIYIYICHIIPWYPAALGHEPFRSFTSSLNPSLLKSIQGGVYHLRDSPPS